jgi:predicted transcriptional regulator
VTAVVVPGLSLLESAVMTVLWDAPEGLLVRAVRERLDWAGRVSGPAAGAALKTLCYQGLAVRDRCGQAWCYRPCRTREEHLAALVRAALSAAPDRSAVLRLALPPAAGTGPRPGDDWEETESAAPGSWLPPVVSSPGIDPARAHCARVQDYWLGGKDNYPADREAGAAMAALVPGMVRSVLESRYFLARAVRFLAGEQGITQFLDIGAGLPAVDSTHEIAQRVRAGARVVYADCDPLVMAHARALLTSGPQGACGHIQADVRDPADLLAGAARTLDLTRPVAVLLLGVLDFVADTGEALAIVRRLMSVVPYGSYLVICHLTPGTGGDGAVARAVQWWNEQGSPPATLRTRGELERFFEGLELTGPGVVSCPHWRPDITGLGRPAEVPHFCGAGRKRAETARA